MTVYKISIYHCYALPKGSIVPLYLFNVIPFLKMLGGLLRVIVQLDSPLYFKQNFVFQSTEGQKWSSSTRWETLVNSGHLCSVNPWWFWVMIGWSFERKTYTWSSRKSSYFEIRRISWNPHEIRRISPEIRTKSGGFHHEIRRISHHEIRQISPWNPPDFERPIARNGKPYV